MYWFDFKEIFSTTMENRKRLLEVKRKNGDIRCLVVDVIRCFGENFGDKDDPEYAVECVISWTGKSEERKRNVWRSQTFEYEKTIIFEIFELSTEELEYLKELLMPYFEIKEVDLEQSHFLKEAIKDEKKALSVTLKKTQKS